jgi:hypothetical protein
MPRALIGILVACIAIAAAAAALAAPCRPARSGGAQAGLVCGTGKYAAHVIANTVSPSGRIALAWRAYKEPPGVSPDADKDIAESLFVRLRDGAILGSSSVLCRDPANTHGNRFFLVAAWSANSRFTVAVFDKPGPPQIDVYTLRQRDDALTGPIDLQPVIASAAATQLPRVQDTAPCEFVPSAERPLTIDNDGLVQGTVVVSRCATGLPGAFDIKIRVQHDSQSPEPSELAADVLSVVPVKAK